MDESAAVEEIVALSPGALSTRSTADVVTWVGGWLGITYGVELFGFAKLTVLPRRAAVADFPWLSPNGDVNTSLRLVYTRARATVDMFTSFEDFGGWDREASVKVPEADRARMRQLCDEERTVPEELLTRMCALHPEMFCVLTRKWAATELAWDHHFLPGPEASYLWRPVDLGSGLAPFTVRQP